MSSSSTPLRSPTSPTIGHLLRNLRDLPRALSLSGFIAGFIIILISYTGPMLIVLQAASAAGLSAEQTSSWVWAIMVGNGITTIALSLLYRQPITAPYSTAGAALLVTSLPGMAYSEAIGAYLLCAAALVVLGISGLFGRVMRLIPQPVVLAVLAGVLLRFGLNIFNAMDDAPVNPIIIIAMVAVFFVLRRLRFAAPSLGAMLIGLVLLGAAGQLNFSTVQFAPTLPVFTPPTFSFGAALGLALPLFALAVSSQFAPGQAVLRANTYDAPINGILVGIGGFSALFAPFGGHGLSLGALTAAIVVGPDAQPDPDRRYASAVMSGVWHIAFGMFGAAVVDLFAIFPAVFVSTIAGLSLSGVLANSLSGALQHTEYRDAGIVAFLCTAGDFALFGIGAPFWGLVAGVAVHALMRWRVRRTAPV